MRRSIGVSALLLGAAGLLSAVAFARKETPRSLAQPRRAALNAPAKQSPSAPELQTATASPFAALPELRLSNLNTQKSLSLQLYDAEGHVDCEAAQKLDGLLVDARDPDHVVQTELNRRTLQLLFRAAYHFRAANVDVVSAYRRAGRRREGLHGEGRAIDFKLPGVTAAALAAYLRTLPRVGVGVYTHPRTQFVHLDTRETSFYWLDASPPGRRWRERSLRDPKLAARDASYRESMDLPESCVGFVTAAR